MSVEQWGILALVVLLPLLDAVARLRRAYAGSGDTTDRIAEVRTSRVGMTLPIPDADRTVVRAAKRAVGRPPSLPPRLPQPVLPPATSLSGLPASHASLKGSAPVEALISTGKPTAGDAVVQRLRLVRNLRRAIVVATILGPPRTDEM